jgi:RNA-directed DNA polymerase
MKMRTATTKFRLGLAVITKWIKLEQLVSDTVDIMGDLRAKLMGPFKYYGVSGNMDMLKSFYNLARRIVYKWLNRRSQRKSYN